MLQEWQKLKRAFVIPVLLVGVMWIVLAAQYITGAATYTMGIYPRKVSALAGILTAPFIHGDWEHLFNNSLPLVFLGAMLIYFYRNIAFEVFMWIYILSGSWVWIVARPSYHIGASMLVYGLASFLFFSGMLRKSLQLMSLSLLVVTLYGGMVWGLLPILHGISWEGHMMGGLAGLICAIYYRKYGTETEKRHITFDDDPDDSDPYWLQGTEEQKPPPADKDPDIEIKYHYKQNPNPWEQQ